MKVVGLCKTFSCADFIPAILPVIYGKLDKIVFVNSDRDWTGHIGENVCIPEILKWKSQYDKDGKIIMLYCHSDCQRKQYEIGYQYILKELNAEWIHIFDTDEVYDQDMFDALINKLPELYRYNGLCIRMKTYVKSPFYRVSPQEPCTPCVMIRPVFGKMQGTRGNFTSPMYFIDDAYFHHFTYVRKTEDEVLSKIVTSTLGDKEDCEQLTHTDLRSWKSNKWDKLPNAYNFHTTKDCERAWKSIEVISEEDLPRTVLDLPIIKQFKEGQNG